MEFTNLITLEQIRAAKPTMIFYGANTCWWTHDPSHLGKTKSSEMEIRRTAEHFRLNSSDKSGPIEPFIERARKAHSLGLPCDPRGGVLFQTDDVEGFLKAAESNATHYGRHGLRAFMAAHHLNCILSFNNCKPWCSPDWDDYNAAIDAYDARKVAQREENDEH